jgi:hypothetical protein
VALGVVHDGDHAAVGADRVAAETGFQIAGAALGLSGDELARRMLATAAEAVGALAMEVAGEYGLKKPTIVAVGGGAGGLGRFAAEQLGIPVHVPELAEVISAVGDALSLVRVERERSITAPTAADQAALARDAEDAAIAAGADAASVDVRVELDDERSALRAIATGMVGLESGALPGRPPIDAERATRLAAEHGAPVPIAVGRFWVASGPEDLPVDRRPTLVLDRFGDPVAFGSGGVLVLTGAASAPGAASLVEQSTRRRGPITTLPTTWLVQGNRATQVPPSELAASVTDTDLTQGDAVAVVLCG